MADQNAASAKQALRYPGMMGWAGIVSAVAYWLFDAVYMADALDMGTLSDMLLRPGADDLAMRTVAGAGFIAFGLLGQRALVRERDIRREMGTLRGRFEEQCEQRTGSLRRELAEHEAAEHFLKEVIDALPAGEIGRASCRERV